MKKAILNATMTLGLLLGLIGVAAFSAIHVAPETETVEAAITSGDLRISVVRPSWWESYTHWQPLRIANTSADLTNNVVANITYYSIESYTSDSYYGEGGFIEYSVNGVIFYDIPFSAISGKYFDLARIVSTDSTEINATKTSVTSRTAPEQYVDGLNNKIWRIWENGNGIYRPEGLSAESRNVSNAVVNSILYGYLTCYNNVNNGYGAFAALDANYNLKGRTYTESDTILDFSSTGDYVTGRGMGVTVLTSAKVAMMDLMDGTPGGINMATPSMFDSSSKLSPLIGFASVLFLIAALKFMFKRKYSI